MTPAVDLIAAWTLRDARYSVRRLFGNRHRLSDSEADMIRWFREKEAAELAGNERRLALATLDRWTPPEVGR